MEPMQCPALAKASVDVKPGKPHCLFSPGKSKEASHPSPRCFCLQVRTRQQRAPHTDTPCRFLSVRFV